MKPHHEKIGYLSPDDCIQLLTRCRIGHLGCSEKGEIYIVPIAFFYEDKHIYCHSNPGRKIEIMRSNPKICFQVDDVEDLFCWKSVMVTGQYEELKSKEAIETVQALVKKISQKDLELSATLGNQLLSQLELAILFRINIEKISGRYEGFKS